MQLKIARLNSDLLVPKNLYILTLVMILKYKRIRELREDNDYTQAQIGNKINVPQRTYAYYESGERMIPPQVLSALADFYNVSVDYILERTDKTETNR